MNELLQETLEEGEKVLWEGKCEDFEVMDPIYKKRIIIGWIVGGIFMLAATIMFVRACMTNPISFGKICIFCAFVYIMPIWLMISPWFEKKQLTNKTTYYLTNLRAIVLSKDMVTKMVISKDMPWFVDAMPNGCGNLYINTNKKIRSPRNWSIHGITTTDDGETKVGAMLFYNVKNADAVAKEFFA
ncbi:MAG: hypothetical protein PHP50_11325 [Lachnospiraceae bacterium]|nr:hypothetical protein [Lachnospiraceae bacterium]